MTEMLMDHAIVVYCIGIIVCTYGSILFASYWYYIGKVSFVYGCITLLLFSQFLSYLACLVARVDFLFANSAVIQSWWWPYRNYPTILCISILVTAMTNRWITTIKDTYPKRRKTDSL